MRSSVLLLTLVVLAGACRCGTERLAPHEASWSVAPARLGFGPTAVGGAVEASLEVVNHSPAPLTLALETQPPFSAPATVSLRGNEVLAVPLSFRPSSEGAFTGHLVVSTPAQAVDVDLEGTATALAACAKTACRDSHRDELNACVFVDLPDGTACEERCVTGTCSSGECVGSAVSSCDDHDACTSDACSVSDGCVHSPVQCAPPESSCLVATCDARLGCRTSEVLDGTPCGEVSCGLCSAGACVPRAECSQWVPESPGSARALQVTDARRSRLLLLQEGTLWERVNQDWVFVPTAHVPPETSCVGYDELRGLVIALGAYAGTWAFDGTDWSQLTPAPRFFADCLLATEPVGHRLLALVNVNGSLPREPSETWSWDGTSWTTLTPAHVPPGRRGGGLALDAPRNQLVLSGGTTSVLGVALDDTWTWDGLDWTEQRVTTPAGGLVATNLRTGRLFKFRFRNLEVHEWLGTRWSYVATNTHAARADSIGFDPRSELLVQFGQLVGPGTTEAWDGVVWTRDPSRAAPAVGDTLFAWNGHALTPFPAQFEWQPATGWNPSGLNTAVPASFQKAAATDTRHGETVLLVTPAFAAPVETWVSSPSGWTKKAPRHSPPIVDGVALEWHPTRQRLVAVGKATPTSTELLTWEWDGADWTERVAANPPRASARHALAFDLVNDQLLLLASSTSNRPVEVWRWNGNDWASAPALTSITLVASAVTDVRRRRIVAVGADQTVTPFRSTTTVFDGSRWVDLGIPSPPALPFLPSLAWDPLRERVTAFTGAGGQVWTLQ